MEPRYETAAAEDTARYCLDVVVSILFNQQKRKALGRSLDFRYWAARLLRSQPVLKRASLDSELQGVMLGEDDVCNALYSVPGLDGRGNFVYVLQYGDGIPNFNGYIPREACQLDII